MILSPGTVLRLALTELKQMSKLQSTIGARTLADADREHILEVLNQTNWLIGGQDGAATRLGLPRTTLIYKMRKLGIEARRSRRPQPIRPREDGESRAFASAAAGNVPAAAFEAVA